MIRRPPTSTRIDTLFPYTTLFRSAEFHGWDRSDQAREGSLGRHLAGTPLVVVAELEGGGDEQPWPIHLSSFLQPYPREFEGAGCDVLSNQWVTHATFGVPRSEERRVGKECVSP